MLAKLGSAPAVCFAAGTFAWLRPQMTVPRIAAGVRTVAATRNNVTGLLLSWDVAGKDDHLRHKLMAQAKVR